MEDHTSPTSFVPKKYGAKSAHVSLRTFDRWIARGLPTYQAYPGGKVLVRLSDIETFLKRTQRPQSNLDVIVEDVMESLRSCGTSDKAKARNGSPAPSFTKPLDISRS